MTATFDPELVAVRPAATVVLLRDGADGLEVWLQQRSHSLVFAGGMFVFPGGAVDDDDRVPERSAFDARRHAQTWGHPLDVARAIAVAACRETAEEAGIELAPESLTPWSRWVTPVGPPRRFDAHFFVAPVPADQSPRPLTGEVAGGTWVVVAAAMDRYLTGDLPMWPPTITTLSELLPYADVAAVVAAAPVRVPVIHG